MCLLVSQPATTAFTDEFLIDVYNKNSDGLGIMYAEAGRLHVYKALPANAQDFVDFYRKHAQDRDCIWHARMKTHGDIDMENCHPYRVTDDIWMAHNGILSTGNDADHTKSDTWHFIKNVLRPSLTADPDLILDPQWVAFMGEVIGGSNKFGLLRSDGEICVINRKSGVEFENSWLSNTYAWSPSRFGFRGHQTYQGGHVYRGTYWEDETTDFTSYANWQTRQLGWRDQQASKAKQNLLADVEEDGVDINVTKVTEYQLKKFVRAAYNQWSRHGLSGVEQWVYDAPAKAAQVLAHWYNDIDTAEMVNLVYKDPEEAAVWINDLFVSDSFTPSWLS